MLSPEEGEASGWGAAHPPDPSLTLGVTSEQRHLSQRLRRLRHWHDAAARAELFAAAAEQEEEIAADPLLRFAVMPELSFVRVGLPIVMGAEHGVQVLVMNH